MIEVFLNMLFGAEPAGSLIEIRYRRERGGMGQHFVGVRETDQAARLVRKLGAMTDCYVGVLPRTERRGGKDAIRQGHVLFVDLDTPEAISSGRNFSPSPSMAISSGNGLHCYWSLAEPLAPQWIEKANRRLAYALGGDMKSTDAARILRPPETFNFKGGERRPVEVESLNVEVYSAADVVGTLPDPPARRPEPREAPRVPIVPGADPILDIPPPIYVEALTGERVGVDGKIRCPLPDHDERTPSFHVYDDAERGWFCFGCGVGGTVYDLAAALWGLETRGEDFKILRRRISERVLNTAVAA